MKIKDKIAWGRPSIGENNFGAQKLRIWQQQKILFSNIARAFAIKKEYMAIRAAMKEAMNKYTKSVQ